MTTKGHCLCKKVAWEFEGNMTWQCYCHCDDCRRNCGAPVVAWLGVPLKNFRWTGDEPHTFESSKGVYRHFCGKCGSLENPSDFEPTFHVNYGSKLHWLNLEDEHERYDSTLAHSDKDLSDYD